MSEYISKYTGAEIDDRLEWAEGITPHVADKANPHEVTKSQVGLGNADNTSDALKPLSTAATVALAGKVDKVAGKGLSANDYTNQDRDKLAGIDVGAEVNPVIADDLTTDDPAKVLSANQGKILKDNADALADIVSTNVGDLETLTTTDKSSLVNATNQVKNLVDTKRGLETVVYDQTFSSEWSTATLVADTNTSNITHTAHGFAEGDIIEFEANGGALPTRMVDTNVDMFGKFYRVNFVDADTYYLSEIGSTTKITFTSTGSGAWRCRKLVFSANIITGLSFDLSYPHRFEIVGEAVRPLGGVATTIYFRINNDTTKRYILSTNIAATSQNYLNLYSANTGNYQLFNASFSIVAMDANTQIRGQCGGLGTTDKSAFTAISSVLDGTVTTKISTLTGYNIGGVISNSLAFRSGLRIRIIREV